MYFVDIFIMLLYSSLASDHLCFLENTEYKIVLFSCLGIFQLFEIMIKEL